MPSIVNGLFSGRAGLESHGSAIAVVGDNISNASTLGYKASRAEFADLMAGGQTTGKVIGSGSQLSAVSPIIEQGTLEFTSRSLDLAIDGGGYFVVADGAQRYYTRAGNFKADASGYLVNSDGLAVLGYPTGGGGALEPLNLNTISQSSVATTEVAISGNLNASATVVAGIPATSVAGVDTASTTTYADLNAAAEFSTVVTTYDSLGDDHTLTFYFFRTGSGSPQWEVRGYVDSQDVDATGSAVGLPRMISTTAGTAAGGTIQMGFQGDGSRVVAGAGALPANGVDLAANVAWNNGAAPSQIDITMSPFSSYSAPSNILSITQDGQGVGAVSKVSIEANGNVYAILDNGQSSVIGRLGLADFASPEGLVRIGGNLLQKSAQSGEPLFGRPSEGKFGKIKANTLELSTVDIASEFVKLITLQRGFQANSRIITTINQLLNDIIQLA